MIEFNTKLPEWKNEGSEPSLDRKTEGFIAGYKPPAAFFNWLFNKIYLCIKEIRENVSNKCATYDDLYKHVASFSVSGQNVEFKNEKGNVLGTFTTQDTKYTASAPLSLEGGSLSHSNSGATAGSYGNSANQTPAYGGTFNVPYVTVDAKGHVTSISNKTVKIPASDNTWRGIQNVLTSTSTTDSLSAAQGKVLNDKLKLVGQWQEEFKSTSNISLTAGTAKQLCAGTKSYGNNECYLLFAEAHFLPTSNGSTTQGDWVEVILKIGSSEFTYDARFPSTGHDATVKCTWVIWTNNLSGKFSLSGKCGTARVVDKSNCMVMRIF